MNRALFILISVSGVSSLLLLDSAIKGAALLLFAGVVVLFLRRDSAATRHLVWLVAIIAMLAVPLLSAMLPQWRVLPDWVKAVGFAEVNRNGSDGNNAIYEADLADHTSHASYDSHDFDAVNALSFDDALRFPSTDADQAASTIESPVTAAIPAAVVTVKPIIWTWHHAISSLWFISFSILIFRLAIARAMLWRTERKSRSCLPGRTSGPRPDLRTDKVPNSAHVAGDHALAGWLRRIVARIRFALRRKSRSASGTYMTSPRATTSNDSESDVYSAFTAACTTLNIRQHVTLLLHPDKTIPVVWGIFRSRLMLPVAAQDWSNEQLRSVLLHELAHIKRRDVLGQLLAQFACALHWFNPLVWIAAWRMHVERERACDDIVLASGVRASAYAEHLLNVATRLSSSPWTQACGLAMARNSSLHGRLTAVLSEKQNRRRVSTTALAAALIICTTVVVPVAMLCATDETPGNKTNASVPISASSEEPVKLLNSLAGPIARTPLTVSVLRDPVEGEKFSPRDASVRLRHRLSEDIPTRVLELVYLLRNDRVFIRSEEWAEATQELVNIGEPALAPLLKELDQTDRDQTLRALGFVLDAMNDPRAVPALIRAIPKTLRPSGSDCGVNIRDPELFQFMKRHDGSPDPNDDSISINRPVGEILDALKHLTEHQWPEGKDELRSMTYDSPEQRVEQSKAYVERQVYWQSWWAEHGEEFLSAADLEKFAKPSPARNQDSPELDEIDKAGMARFEPLFPTGPNVEVSDVFETELFWNMLADAPSTFDLDRHQGARKLEGATDNDYLLWGRTRGVDVFCGDQMQGCNLRIWTVDSSLWSTIIDDVRNAEPLSIGEEPRGGFMLLTPEQNTVVFLTNEGSQGILQFHPFNPATGSRRIRYRLWKFPWFQPPANKQETPPAESPNWDPVIEVTLHAADAEGAECAWSHSTQEVRLMSGVDAAELSKNIRELHEAFEFQGWQNQNRVSFMVQRTTKWKSQPTIISKSTRSGGAAEGLALVGFNLLALPVRPTAFTDLSVAAAQDVFLSEPPNRWHTSTVFGEFDEYPLQPQTQVFRHQSGKIGLVQVTKSDVKKGTLSFRYKMAGKAPALVSHEQLNSDTATNSTPKPGSQVEVDFAIVEQQTPTAFEQSPVEKLIRQWQQYARSDGRIPAALLGTVRSQVDTFVKQYPTDEYIEVKGHGIGIGPGPYEEEISTGSVGAWVEAKAGDNVRFATTVNIRSEAWMRPNDPKDPEELRKASIAERIAMESPLPASEADRKLLIEHVTNDIFGETPTDEEVSVFINDHSPDALLNLAVRLQQRLYLPLFVGSLQTGEVEFRVLAIDPTAATKPRRAIAPGRYVLGESVQLAVQQVTSVERFGAPEIRTNNAKIIFLSPDPKVESPHPPFEIKLPDGNANYAILWTRNTGMLYVVEFGRVRTIDYSDPANVTESQAKVNLAPEYKPLVPPQLLK